MDTNILLESGTNELEILEFRRYFYAERYDDYGHQS